MQNVTRTAAPPPTPPKPAAPNPATPNPVDQQSQRRRTAVAQTLRTLAHDTQVARGLVVRALESARAGHPYPALQAHRDALDALDVLTLARADARTRVGNTDAVEQVARAVRSLRNLARTFEDSGVEGRIGRSGISQLTRVEAQLATTSKTLARQARELTAG